MKIKTKCSLAIIILVAIISFLGVNYVQAIEYTIGEGIYIVVPNHQNEIEVGKSLQLSVGYLEGLEEQEVNWESSDSSIATVDSTGKVTGEKEGTVKITLSTKSGEYDSAEEFTIVKNSDNHEIGIGDNICITQKDEIKVIQKGDTLQLDIEGVESLSNIKNEDVTWSSSDNNIATVDSKGLVKSKESGKVTIKAEYDSYSSTYEIEITDVSNLEPPIEIVNDIYNFSSNKEKIIINIGSSDKVEIIAKVKDGIVMIDEVLMVKDNWDIEWKIEDETIAACVPEKGIENNKYGGTQVAGRATIQGLKSGTTYLVAKIKLSTDKYEEIKIPITVNESKEDKTISPNPPPKTGEKNTLLVFAGIIVASLSVYFGIKYKKNK